MLDVATMLKAIHASEDLSVAMEKAKAVCIKIKGVNFREAAKKIQESIGETFTYYAFPRKHRVRIRANNALGGILREIRRRTRVVGTFPDGCSELMLCAARFRHMAGIQWGSERYLDMELLREHA